MLHLAYSSAELAAPNVSAWQGKLPAGSLFFFGNSTPFPVRALIIFVMLPRSSSLLLRIVHTFHCHNSGLVVRKTHNSFFRFRSYAFLVLCTALLAGCTTDPNSLAMQVGASPANALELRTLQTRQLQTRSAVEVMHAATQVMQDLGFTVKESSADVGVLVGAKQRDAEEAGEVAGAVALSVLGAVAGVYVEPVWDTDQEINMTLVQYPTASPDKWDVRVSFDRTITNSKRQQRAELIMDPKIYQDFFQKLEQGVFLEKSK